MVKRRFSAKQSTIYSGLQKTMERFNATSLKVIQDIMNPESKIIFDRNGKRYTWKCSNYDNASDNLRAIQLSLDYIWRITDAYGVSNDEKELDVLLNNLLLASEATPDDSCLLLSDGNKQWFEVLGIKEDSDERTIINAFKSLAKVHHPDVGGTNEDFKRIREAYDIGMKNI